MDVCSCGIEVISYCDAFGKYCFDILFSKVPSSDSIDTRLAFPTHPQIRTERGIAQIDFCSQMKSMLRSAIAITKVEQYHINKTFNSQNAPVYLPNGRCIGCLWWVFCRKRTMLYTAPTSIGRFTIFVRSSTGTPLIEWATEVAMTTIHWNRNVVISNQKFSFCLLPLQSTLVITRLILSKIRETPIVRPKGRYKEYMSFRWFLSLGYLAGVYRTSLSYRPSHFWGYIYGWHEIQLSNIAVTWYPHTKHMICHRFMVEVRW